MEMTTAAGLWLAVLLSGLYHGLNPGMGWPLAVSSALFERRRSALWSALGALSVGHFAAMLGILLPFSMMTLLIDFEREIRVGAGLIVISMGLYLAATRKHPRFLARHPATQADFVVFSGCTRAWCGADVGPDLSGPLCH